MVGDTTVVRTMTGSVWGDSIPVSEELRVGTLDGAPEYQFNQLSGFAVTPAGGFLVFDGSVPSLREFTAEGRYVRTLGRPGNGPGEYRDNLGIAVLGDGTVLQYDVGNTRINRYTSSGEVLPAWPAPGQLYSGDALVTDSADRVYTTFLRGEPKPDVDWDIVYLMYAHEGSIIDTVEAPYTPGATASNQTQYHPRRFWKIGPLGYRIEGNIGTYAVTLLKPSGPIRVERGISASRWEPVFREEMNARFNTPRPGSPPGPRIELPDTMPAFESVDQMPDGRLWVKVYDRTRRLDADEIRYDPARPTVAIVSWGLVRAWDIFEEDGTYLGRLRLPPGAEVLRAGGARLWAMEKGESGEQYIVRYRIGPT